MKKISHEIAIKLGVFTFTLALVVVIFLFKSAQLSVSAMNLEKSLINLSSLSNSIQEELDHGQLLVKTLKSYVSDFYGDGVQTVSPLPHEDLNQQIELVVQQFLKEQVGIVYVTLYYFPDDKEKQEAFSLHLEGGSVKRRNWDVTQAVLKATDDATWRSVLETGTQESWSGPYLDSAEAGGNQLLAYGDTVFYEGERLCHIVVEFSPVEVFKEAHLEHNLNGRYIITDGQFIIYDQNQFTAEDLKGLSYYFPLVLDVDQSIVHQIDQQGLYTATVTAVGDSWKLMGLYTKESIQKAGVSILIPWVLIFFGLFFFVMLGVYWLTKELAKPLGELTRAITSYDGLDVHFEIPFSIRNKHNEFFVLSSGIQSLIARIAQFNEKIEMQNQELIHEIEIKEKMISQLSIASKIIESSGEGICITDHAFKITYVNERFIDISGYDRGELIGLDISKMDPNQSHLSNEIREELKMYAVWSGYIRQIKKDGTLYDQKLTLRAMKNDQGIIESYIGTVNELHDSFLGRAESRAYDMLTGLITKETLVSELKQKIEMNHKPFAMLLLGIDGFRAINQTLGHEFGDEILRRMTSRILNTLPTAGAFVSRFGGDEFGIVLENTLEHLQLVDLAESLLSLTNEPFVVGDERVFITTSIGICHYPEDAESVDDLFKRITSALHVAKESGRKTYKFFSREELDLVNRHIKLMGLMHEGWANKEFYIVYQPKIDLVNSQVVGAEALMRWKSSSIGEVSPAEFIPIAEELGLINQMGAWCIYEAASKVRQMNLNGFESFRISVNVSYYQLMDEDIIATIKEAISTHRISPESLELEITESILMTNIKRASDILTKLKGVGVFISVDDFGTGYSSLSYLKNLPIDILKIDRGFIRDIPSEVGTLAKIIIQLAENLSMQVIAEGVETIEQIEFLKANRCFEAQGYFYSKPIEFVDFLPYCVKKNGLIRQD